MQVTIRVFDCWVTFSTEQTSLASKPYTRAFASEVSEDAVRKAWAWLELAGFKLDGEIEHYEGDCWQFVAYLG